MMRAFVSLRHVPVGFDASYVITMSAEVTHLGMVAPEQRLAFFNSVTDAIRAVPGVTRAGLGLPIPLGGTGLTQRYALNENAAEQIAVGLTILIAVRVGAVAASLPAPRAAPVSEPDDGARED